MPEGPPHHSSSTADDGRLDDAVASVLWNHAAPESQGVESRALIRAVSRIRDDDVDLHSLIMIRNGNVILESYLPPYDKNTLHNVKSVTKSIMSALVGVALEKGILKSLDQTVLEFFPEYVTDDLDPRKRSITIRHLLTMTSGLDLDENGPIMHGIFASDDWIEATLARPMACDPGQRFLYSTPLTHIMSGILTRASGQGLLELCKHNLFEPLDIADVQWRQDSKGYFHGGSELFMTPRAMAKIGLLFLNQGRWGGDPVVPAAWVRDSTRDQMAGIEADDQFGYWWWQVRFGEDGYKAAGWGGQRIFVLPHWNMVAVATSADPDGFHKLFHDFDPSSIGDAALPPDPDAQRELNALLRDLEQPRPRPIPDPPSIAKKISGRTYRLDAADRHTPFNEVAFDFSRPDRTAMTIGTEKGTYRLAVGLDGLYRTTVTDTFGRMPRGNQVAVRGRWIGEASFAMDYLEVGDPNHARVEVRFSKDQVSLSVVLEPNGTTFAARGIEAP